jgi:competence protein ComEA
VVAARLSQIRWEESSFRRFGICLCKQIVGLARLDPPYGVRNNVGLVKGVTELADMHETNRPKNCSRLVLRRWDQAAVAGLVLCALAGMSVYWVVNGGPRDGLIEIDRAEPLTARYQVDINAASWPELAELPRVGETLAQRIVESRMGNGPYVDHEDLLRVPGIGPRTLEQIKPYLLPMPGRGEVAGDVRELSPVQ